MAKFTKSELRQMIREVLKEELSRKKHLKEDARQTVDWDALYATLDDAMASGENVLIKGQPGYGNLANIRKWCDENGLTYVCLNVKDTELLDALLGYDDMLSSTYNRQLNNINGSVLIIDEFDRAKPQDRPGLLSVVSERQYGQLFTIAVVNNRDALNAAEREHFFPLHFEV